MDPESACLISLARGDKHPPLQLSRTVALERLEALSDDHQVAALCAVHLEENAREEGGWSALPRRTRRYFEMSRLRHRHEHVQLVRDLRDLSEEFTRKGIDALVLKGPWLAFHAYPSADTRPIGDIDLCVPERDYDGALEVLCSLDYLPSLELPHRDSALQSAHYRRQLRFKSPSRTPVELHFRMINIGPPRDERWVRQTCRQVAIGGREIRVPGPEAMLLHLLIHANQHGFSILRLFHDIRFALERDRFHIDFELLFEQVASLRCGPAAYFGLLLSADLAGARVDSIWLNRFQPSSFRQAIFRVAWRPDRIRSLCQPKRAQRLEAPRFYLLEVGNLREKLRYLAKLLSSSER